LILNKRPEFKDDVMHFSSVYNAYERTLEIEPHLESEIVIRHHVGGKKYDMTRYE